MQDHCLHKGIANLGHPAPAVRPAMSIIISSYGIISMIGLCIDRTEVLHTQVSKRTNTAAQQPPRTIQQQAWLALPTMLADWMPTSHALLVHPLMDSRMDMQPPMQRPSLPRSL